MNNFLISNQNMPSRKPDGPPKTYQIVMIAHHWPFIPRKRSELQKEECFIGGISRYPHASFSRLALRKVPGRE